MISWHCVPTENRMPPCNNKNLNHPNVGAYFLQGVFCISTHGCHECIETVSITSPYNIVWRFLLRCYI